MEFSMGYPPPLHTSIPFIADCPCKGGAAKSRCFSTKGPARDKEWPTVAKLVPRQHAV